MSKISVPVDTDTPISPNLRSAINNALLAHNAIPKIQAALLHQCQTTGFTAALRQRTLELLRSGECNSYGEVMDKIMSELKINSADSISLNGSGKNGATPELKVPEQLVQEGIVIVRDALDGIIMVGEKQD